MGMHQVFLKLLFTEAMACTIDVGVGDPLRLQLMSLLGAGGIAVAMAPPS
jgi:hypothetical protein